MAIIPYTKKTTGVGDADSIQLFITDDPYHADIDNRPLGRIHDNVAALDAAVDPEHNSDGTHKAITVSDSIRLKIGSLFWILKPVRDTSGTDPKDYFLVFITSDSAFDISTLTIDTEGVQVIDLATPITDDFEF